MRCATSAYIVHVTAPCPKYALSLQRQFKRMLDGSGLLHTHQAQATFWRVVLFRRWLNPAEGSQRHRGLSDLTRHYDAPRACRLGYFECETYAWIVMRQG
jgi:hypothetical protein